jgi:hypothetical protein
MPTEKGRAVPARDLGTSIVPLLAQNADAKDLVEERPPREGGVTPVMMEVEVRLVTHTNMKVAAYRGRLSPDISGAAPGFMGA